MADHIGRYPAVLISPYDTDLIRQGSEERRKYFDSLMAQLDHEFLELLISYNALLRQRNAVLKQGDRPSHGFDRDYLLALDEQLAPLGQQLTALRAAFLTEYRAHLSAPLPAAGRWPRSRHAYLQEPADRG